jgi:integrase
MKLKLTETFIGKLRAGEIPVSVERPYPGTKTTAANYLLYDETPGTPSGFALRVGKNSATYILDTVVGGKKTKITIGLAKGKSGTKPIISLKAARDQGTQLLAQAHQLGINPLVRAKADHADLMTMGEVWSEYIKYLQNKAEPVKPNSLKAIEKARKKLAEFDDQKVADIDPERVVELFSHHAKTLAHPTAAEQMGRWGIAAVKKVMEMEDHAATHGKRSSRLTSNPFEMLQIRGVFRTREQLENEYKSKAIRNPLDLITTGPAFFNAAWEYRRENPLGADFLILATLWGLRLGEACTFAWKERLPTKMLKHARWVDLESETACITDSKNRSNHEFRIAPCAMEILRRRKATMPTDQIWVFPAASPLSKVQHYTDATVALARIVHMANESLKDSGSNIDALRGHDLRRSFGAACDLLGFDRRQTKFMLGHSPGGDVTDRYMVPSLSEQMARVTAVEKLMLHKTRHMYHALTGDIDKLLEAT